MNTILREIILENFMSYEYARIPLKKGLNIICGPNGAGKSSILLAISVALGQAHTERSRKLSALIRHGKDIARVALIFDNSSINGRRPIPSCKSDTFMLARYLKRDGNYWYEADYRVKSKLEVERSLRDLGINPDNMLILMHQYMLDKFSSISPQEKLRLVEEAVGFHLYRQRILDAQNELSNLISEETSLVQVLESTENTLAYWSELRAKYQKKLDLLRRVEELEHEAVWAQIIKQERTLSSLEEKLNTQKRELVGINARISDAKIHIKESKDQLTNIAFEQKKMFIELVRLEKEKTKKEIFKEINGLKGIDEEIAKAQVELSETEKRQNIIIEKYIGDKIKEAVLSYQREVLENEIGGIERSINDVGKRIAALPKRGERIDTGRSLVEISTETKLVKAHIETFADVPNDVEEMYKSVEEMYEELRKKLEIIKRNKERAMEGIAERKKIWRTEIDKLLREINATYKQILSKINATGRVRLLDPEDIENVGLEMYVGFGGQPPTVLDAYTLSGGERSSSIMAFLLCLQQRVKSPMRAVDEFEVHMDPRNKEIILRELFSSIGDTQYIMITPNPLTLLSEDANIIVVQNASGDSTVLRGQ